MIKFLLSKFNLLFGRSIKNEKAPNKKMMIRKRRPFKFGDQQFKN
jgi:hypothetical protein